MPLSPSSQAGIALLTLIGVASGETVPFTAYAEVRSKSGNGQHPGAAVAVRQSTVFARRADGSTALHTKAVGPNGETLEVAEISTDASGKTVKALDFSTKTWFTVRKTAPNGSGGTCVGGEVAQETVAGYRVLRVSSVWSSQPGREVRIEEWVAPELGCFPLRRKVVRRSPDGDLSLTESEVYQVTTGDPPAALFAVPEGFAEKRK